MGSPPAPAAGPRDGGHFLHCARSIPSVLGSAESQVQRRRQAWSIPGLCGGPEWPPGRAMLIGQSRFDRLVLCTEPHDRLCTSGPSAKGLLSMEASQKQIEIIDIGRAAGDKIIGYDHPKLPADRSHTATNCYSSSNSRRAVSEPRHRRQPPACHHQHRRLLHRPGSGWCHFRGYGSYRWWRRRGRLRNRRQRGCRRLNDCDPYWGFDIDSGRRRRRRQQRQPRYRGCCTR